MTHQTERPDLVTIDQIVTLFSISRTTLYSARRWNREAFPRVAGMNDDRKLLYVTTEIETFLNTYAADTLARARSAKGAA